MSQFSSQIFVISSHLLLRRTFLVMGKVVASTAPEHWILFVIKSLKKNVDINSLLLLPKLYLGYVAARHPPVALLDPHLHVVILLHLGLYHLQ